MPPRTVSRDLEAPILILYYEQNFTVKEICGLLGIKKSLAYKMLLYSSTYGVPYNPHARTGGCRWILNREDTGPYRTLTLHLSQQDPRGTVPMSLLSPLHPYFGSHSMKARLLSKMCLNLCPWEKSHPACRIYEYHCWRSSTAWYAYVFRWGCMKSKDIWKKTRLGFGWKKMCAEKVLCLRKAMLNPPSPYNGWNHHV